MTTSDAIALGSMIAALMAACAGLVRGDAARASARTDERTSSVAHSDLNELAAAVRDLAEVVRAAIALAACDRWGDTLQDILQRMHGGHR